jgi:hypothetical protein
MQKIELLPVYPVFRKYYDTSPLGSIELRNREKTAGTDTTFRPACASHLM